MLEKLRKLQQQSEKRKIPILSREKSRWLMNKVKQLKPQKILELGTANGYSGTILGSEGAELITVEINKKIAEEAAVNFAEFGINARIIIGNSVEIVKDLVKNSANDKNKNLTEEKTKKRKVAAITFDLIFIDFSKKNYIHVLENCIRLLNRNGLIIADNINMEKCKDFKEAILAHPLLKTEIIEIGDGLSCSKRIK